MLRGYIDVLTSDGYFHGWAFDTNHALNPRHVSIFTGEQEVARGIANFFREDLVAENCGAGWCGFRLGVRLPLSRLQMRAFRLVDQGSWRILHTVGELSVEKVSGAELKTIKDIRSADPTTLESVDQLNGCDHFFAEFISRNGVEAFVCAAYAYILSRPVDAAGLKNYSRLLRLGFITPLMILKILGESEEFKSIDHNLGAPTAASFPFRVA